MPDNTITASTELNGQSTSEQIRFAVQVMRRTRGPYPSAAYTLVKEWLERIAEEQDREVKALEEELLAADALRDQVAIAVSEYWMCNTSSVKRAASEILSGYELKKKA